MPFDILAVMINVAHVYAVMAHLGNACRGVALFRGLTDQPLFEAWERGWRGCLGATLLARERGWWWGPLLFGPFPGGGGGGGAAAFPLPGGGGGGGGGCLASCGLGCGRWWGRRDPSLDTCMHRHQSL